MGTLSLEQAIRLALDLFRRGRLRESEAVLDQILDVEPEAGDALALRGLLEYERGDFEAAAEWHRRAVRARPEEPLYRCNLATTFVARGQLDEAMRWYERARTLVPEHAVAVAGAADVLERKGERGDAYRLLRPRVEQKRATPRMAVVYARLLAHGRRFERVVRFLDEQLERADVAGDDRRSMLFQLGWALDRLDRADDAFEAFSRANAIGAHRYDRDRADRMFAALAPLFSRAGLAAIPAASRATELPVFVVGMPRSGTTLVEQIIQAHPEGVGAGEIPDLAELLRRMPKEIGTTTPYPGCVRELEDGHVDRLAGQYQLGLRRRCTPARRIVDKTLANFDRLGIIARLFPQAAVLHVRRDPLDTCLSCFMHDLPPRLHPYSTDLANLGHRYRACARQMRFWREEAGLAIVEVEYERLVTEPDGQIRRLIDAVGLDWNERCLEFHAEARDVATISYDQVHRPIDGRAVGRFRRYERHLGPLREALGDAVD